MTNDYPNSLKSFALKVILVLLSVSILFELIYFHINVINITWIISVGICRFCREIIYYCQYSTYVLLVCYELVYSWSYFVTTYLLGLELSIIYTRFEVLKFSKRLKNIRKSTMLKLKIYAIFLKNTLIIYIYLTFLGHR